MRSTAHTITKVGVARAGIGCGIHSQGHIRAFSPSNNSRRPIRKGRHRETLSNILRTHVSITVTEGNGGLNNATNTGTITVSTDTDGGSINSTSARTGSKRLRGNDATSINGAYTCTLSVRSITAVTTGTSNKTVLTFQDSGVQSTDTVTKLEGSWSLRRVSSHAIFPTSRARAGSSRGRNNNSRCRGTTNIVAALPCLTTLSSKSTGMIQITRRNSWSLVDYTTFAEVESVDRCTDKTTFGDTNAGRGPSKRWRRRNNRRVRLLGVNNRRNWGSRTTASRIIAATNFSGTTVGSSRTNIDGREQLTTPALLECNGRVTHNVIVRLCLAGRSRRNVRSTRRKVAVTSVRATRQARPLAAISDLSRVSNSIDTTIE